MRVFCVFFLAGLLAGAEPDWKKMEPMALDFFQRYVRVQSINPPANDTEASNLVKGLLESHGIPVKLFPSGPRGQLNLLARLPGRDRSKKPLLLLNHFDVVPVDRKAWKLDPFAAIIQDGFIWGRGTMDMKGIATQQMMAFVMLKDAGIVPSRDIILLSTADEETDGELGIQYMIEHHFDEINAEFVLDEGGFGTRSILADGKLVFGVAVGEKQSVWLEGARARNRRARLTTDSGQCQRDAAPGADQGSRPPPSKPHPVVAEMVHNIGAPLAKNKYTDALQGNTISLTTLTAGVGSPPKVNVIPSTSEASIDCRLLPGVNSAEFSRR